MDVADKKQIMPPKSTWFEPKPSSGAIVRCMDLTLDDYLNLKKWEISHFFVFKNFKSNEKL